MGDVMMGISLTVLSTVIGGVSKLAIRKSWLMEQHQRHHHHQPLPTTSERFDEGVCGKEDFDGNQISNEKELESCQISTNDGILPTRHHSSIGSNSHNNNRLVPILLRRFGMLGMTTLNPLLTVWSNNYASPSILAPFAGLTLAWIVLFSESLVGEKPSRQQIIAATLIVAGDVVIAIFGDHTNDDGKSVEDVVNSYQETGFILFIIAMCAWMIFLLYYMFIPSATAKTSPRFQQLAWGAAGGSITGFQNFIKDALTIVKASTVNNNNNQSDNNNNNNEFPYLLLICMFGMAIATAFTGLIFVSLCMKRYDATYSEAMFVGSFCISASIMSAIHYDTFAHLNHSISYVGYPTGLFIVLYGVYLVLVSTTATDSGETTVSRSVTDSDGDTVSRSNPASRRRTNLPFKKGDTKW